MCTNFQAKQTTLTFLAQICPKMDLGLEIQKTNVGIRISIIKLPCVPVFRKKGQLWHFRPNLPKNRFWGRNFKNLSLDWDVSPPIYHECQFSVKMDNFWFFGLTWGNCPIACNILVQILLRVLQRAGWRLKWAWWTWMELSGGWNELGRGEWSWVKLSGGGWDWMEVGARFSNTRNECIKVNKSVYTAKSRQRYYKTLKKTFCCTCQSKP